MRTPRIPPTTPPTMAPTLLDLPGPVVSAAPAPPVGVGVEDTVDEWVDEEEVLLVAVDAGRDEDAVTSGRSVV